MIDFQNASFFKLKPVHPSAFSDMIAPLLLEKESII